jgi:hypothetical protein
MKNILLKTTVTFFVILNTNLNLKAQEYQYKSPKRIYASADLTALGKQGRLSYEFYTPNGRCFGISIAQLGGLTRMNDDKTLFYKVSDIRLNLSASYTIDVYEHRRVRLFEIFQAGISYNTILTGEQLILPSFRAGVGIDFTIYKESGLRLEAGIGSPYALSIGYFFAL